MKHLVSTFKKTILQIKFPGEEKNYNKNKYILSLVAIVAAKNGKWLVKSFFHSHRPTKDLNPYMNTRLKQSLLLNFATNCGTKNYLSAYKLQMLNAFKNRKFHAKEHTHTHNIVEIYIYCMYMK